MVEGFSDGFLDEAFLEADAKLAGGDLDEVFGFEGGQALERVFEKSLLGGGTALLREGGVDFRDLGKSEGWPHGLVAQDFLSARAEVAVTAKDRGEFRGAIFCDGSDSAKEKREADGEDAFLTAGKNAPAQVKRGEGGLLDRCGAEIVRHQADFFVFFGGGGDGFAELGEAEHGGRPVSHGVMKRTEGGTLRLLEARCSHRIGAI